MSHWSNQFCTLSTSDWIHTCGHASLAQVGRDGREFLVVALLGAHRLLSSAGTSRYDFTPRIMGKIMGLPPAIILLSLSVWGYALGIIGLILALPVTTLAISYYKRYVVGEENAKTDGASNSFHSKLSPDDIAMEREAGIYLDDPKKTPASSSKQTPSGEEKK